MSLMTKNVQKALKAYKIFAKIAKKPIIYGSLAYNIVTGKDTKINDLDILVSKKELPLLSQKIKGAVYHKKYDTVHAQVAGIKVELDARERWGPKKIVTKKVAYKKTNIRIVSKQTLIWFYRRGTKKAHKDKLKQLRT